MVADAAARRIATSWAMRIQKLHLMQARPTLMRMHWVYGSQLYVRNLDLLTSGFNPCASSDLLWHGCWRSQQRPLSSRTACHDLATSAPHGVAPSSSPCCGCFVASWRRATCHSRWVDRQPDCHRPVRVGCRETTKKEATIDI